MSEPTQLTARALDRFLADVEKRAFRVARMATHSDADALDIVQDAMFKLVANYRERPSEEWRPLFYRILEHRIMDWHRQQTKTKKWFFWSTRKEEEDDHPEPVMAEGISLENPMEMLASERLSAEILKLIEALPLQQQQCFLLRHWEGLSVNETAEALQISAGSVKTHMYRAMQKLQEMLEEHQLKATGT